MGFVKTKDELERYYGLGVRQFLGARMLGIMFASPAELTAPLLPPPLEQAELPGGLIFIAEYPRTNLGPGYREAALFIRCRYQGEAGSYCLSMPITNEARMHNGRDIFGLPKRMADIHLERKGDQAWGWVERNGVRFVEIRTRLEGALPELPPMGPTFLFKAMPRIDLAPGFDGPVLLCSQKTEIVARSIDLGTGELILRPAADDPWADLGTPEILASFFLVSDNTMLPGKVLAEADAEAYLPHYFKMTDFSTGE